VVVPCYKVLPWVDRCMETLAAQTIESIEIIAVDDGSPDATGERLDEWAARFPGRIRVIHKPNGGCASARNAGLLAARGTYVAFVDGDDWVEPPMFEALYRSAVQYGSDIAQCGYTEVYEDSGRTERFPTAWEAGQSAGALGLVTSPHKFLGLKPTIWRRIYRRDFLLGNGISFPEHVRRFDDLPFQFEALARAQRMSVIPDCYYNYRLERAGQDVAAKGAKLFVHFPIFDWLQEHVGAWADVKIERALFECKLNTHLWALPRIGKELEGTYTSLVAHDIFGRRTYMSLLEMFRVALRQGPGAALFLLRCFGRARLAPPAMVPSD